MTRTKISLAAAITAHIFAWVATLFFLFWPIYSGVSVSAGPGESGISSVSGKTLIEVNGLWSALLLVLPIIVTAVGLIATLPGTARPRIMLTFRWASFTFLLLFCVAGIYSIGIFYLPAAISMLVTAIVKRTDKD